MRSKPVHRARQVLRVLAAALLLFGTITAGASSCGATATKTIATATNTKPEGMAAGIARCIAVDAADPVGSCCTVGTSAPAAGKPGPGAVGAHVIVKCLAPVEVFNLEVYLDYTLGGEKTTVDQCSFYEPADLGKYCTVSTSCKAGLYDTSWQLDVSINGNDKTETENGDHYQAYISQGKCDATRHTGGA